MSTTDTNTESDSDSIDPRLTKPFTQAFADSVMRTDELAVLIAELHDDTTLRHYLVYHIKHHLDQHYAVLDTETRDQLAGIIADKALSSLFPYRNHLIDGYLADIQPADRIFKQLEAYPGVRDEPRVHEYQVMRLKEYGTEAYLWPLRVYDPETGEVIAEGQTEIAKSSAGTIHVHAGQLAYDDAWYVVRAPREGGDN